MFTIIPNLIKYAKEEQEKALNEWKEEVISAQREVANILSRGLSDKEIYDQEIQYFQNLMDEKLILEDQFLQVREQLTNEYLKREKNQYLSIYEAVFASVSRIMADLNSEGNETLMTINSLLTDVMSIVKGWASGDIGSLAGGIIGYIYDLIDLLEQAGLVNQEAYALTKQIQDWHDMAEVMNRDMAITLRILEDQLATLEQISGRKWWNQNLVSLYMFHEAIAEAENGLAALADTAEAIDPEWGVDQWQEFLDDHPDFEFSVDAQGFIDTIKSLQSQTDELIAGIKESLTGTTAESITDTIAQALADGKTSIGDFADTFEDLMKQAMLNTFQRQFLADQFAAWYDKFAEYMEPGTWRRGELTGSGIPTPEEIASLQDDWNEIIGNASERWQAMMDAMGGVDFFGETDDPNSLTGAIRAQLTEETGTVLAGHMTNMMLTMHELLSLQTDMRDSLESIEKNTRYNARLVQIEKHLKDLNTKMS